MAENEKEIQETAVSADTSAAKAVKKAKAKKPNFFVRLGGRIKKFWKEYISELKKVSWMSWKDVKKNTLLVVCAVVAFSAAIAVVDTVFGEIIKGIAGLVG